MRFVILDHKPHSSPSPKPKPSNRTDERHFDLMFETKVGEKLRTIAVLQLPTSPDVEVKAESLPDHRSEFLTYEGELTKNRGSVSRFAWGTWQGELTTKANLVFDEASANFPAESWELRFDADHGTLLRIS